MKIAYDWLCEMLGEGGDDRAGGRELDRDGGARPLPDAQAAAHLLTMGGLEVEDQAPLASFTQVVVARVVEVERHPNADRLSVCRVDTGSLPLRTVVCGAPNVAAGLHVPCALPGALLPGDFSIKSSTVRGVRSDGMLCSAKELGLSEEGGGLLVLDAAAVPGTDLRSFLGLDDAVFDIKTTPNRGDCLSVLGVARELAALGALRLRVPRVEPVAANCPDRLNVRIDAPDLCGRFSGRVLRGVNARAPTPTWMRRRLEQAGQRSISALVDISNTVMLELGQPSHVFDLSKVSGGLHVRWARPGENIALLNEQTRTLDANIGVVADDQGAEAIAGIMGGLATSVTLDTTDVYLEAAFWKPGAIQGRPRALNLASEAAHRFERGVDFAATVTAIERLTQLIVEVCGTPATRIGPVDDTIVDLPARAPVALRLGRLRRVLGLPISAAEAQSCFDRLGLAWSGTDDIVHVTPPSYRFDLQCEEDLIEEVARIFGYDHIPAQPPLARTPMRVRDEGRRGPHDLRLALARSGYQELVNFSFVPDEWERDLGADPARAIHVLNPIVAGQSTMRSTLLGGLLANLRYNLNRQAGRVRTFELGRVFARDAGQADGPSAVAGVAQPLRIAALAFGQAENEQWGVAARAVDYFDVKGDLERLLLPLEAKFSAPDGVTPATLAAALHPGRRAAVRLGERVIGVVGELHPRLLSRFELPGAPVLFEIDVDAVLDVGVPAAEPVSRFPSLVRDIAVWMDEAVPAGEVLDDLRSIAGRRPELSSVRSVGLFDVFRGAAAGARHPSADSPSGLLNKEKSLAFRIVLQDTQRSLTEADADAARAEIVEHLQQRWGARVRQ